MEKPATAPAARRAPLYRPLKAVLSRPLRRVYRVRVEGLEHVPRHGPVILAPNHLAFVDSLFLAAVVPRRISYVAKAEYFDARRTAWLFRATGQIALRRGDGRAAATALDAALAVLAGGGVVGIFPEGTRSRDGRLRRGTTGPARLALSSGAPLVPVGLVGTDRVQPVGRRLPRPHGEVTVRFGPPLDLAGIRATDGLAHSGLRRTTDELMASIAVLSGQQRARRAEPAPVSP